MIAYVMLKNEFKFLKKNMDLRLYLRSKVTEVIALPGRIQI